MAFDAIHRETTAFVQGQGLRRFRHGAHPRWLAGPARQQRLGPAAKQANLRASHDFGACGIAE